MGRGKDEILRRYGGLRLGESLENGVPPRWKEIDKLRAKRISTMEDVGRLVALTRIGEVLPDGCSITATLACSINRASHGLSPRRRDGGRAPVRCRSHRGSGREVDAGKIRCPAVGT